MIDFQVDVDSFAVGALRLVGRRCDELSTDSALSLIWRHDDVEQEGGQAPPPSIAQLP